MKITDLLNPKGFDLNAHVSTKEEAIDRLVDLMASTGNLADKEAYKRCVKAREQQGTTGIGEGVAIPHAKTPAVLRPGLAVMVVRGGCDYGAMDGQPTRLFFLIAAPDTEDNIHLDVLGRLSALLMDDRFRQSLLRAKSVGEFCRLVDNAENAKNESDAKLSAQAPPSSGYRLLAVTACPTGIAHTYMAAEGLAGKAKEMGISIKVETDGSGGVKNALTPEEIAQCEAVIIAADREVEMARFDGKPLVQTQVSDGINKPQALIERALSGSAPVYHAASKAASPSGTQGGESAGRKIYKDLMNGVSHMLPFVIGGGILMALAFLLDTIFAPNGPSANFGMNSPAAAFFKTAGNVAFGFMLPVLAGFIAMAIADRPGLMVGFVGGSLANLGVCFQNGQFVDVNTADASVVSSGFLGALVAGFLGGYLVLGLEKLCDRLPRALEGIKPILIYPLAGLLAISALMIFVLDPLFSALNVLISNGLNSLNAGGNLLVSILLGALVAGMMSVDMGGPVNKAAYLFGTASLVVNGQAVSSTVMASVMIGGMIPPLAVALCTTFFKNRFTQKERSSGATNYIMGLCFVTEGVIPFAAADPLRVIPSCIGGSAVAGALSMAFGCALPAPHGGVFVLPVVSNWPMYLVALAAGSLVAMCLLAALRKPLPPEKSGLPAR